MEDDCFSIDISARADLVNLFFLESFFSFFVGLFPQRHLESILWVLENN